MIYLFLKRLFDIVFSLMAIIILSPILFLIAILVWLNLGTPILFRQERPGLYGKIFTMYKFRSMKQSTKKDDYMTDEIRLTNFGRKLRATSLDELPELFNILKGDMSIVGPRPLLVEYLPLYNSRQAQRHDVRPGLTGLAQVKGRNALSWKEKFEYDVYYVAHLNFLLDCKIIFWTIKAVIKKDGIHSDKAVTMEPFRGN